MLKFVDLVLRLFKGFKFVKLCRINYNFIAQCNNHKYHQLIKKNEARCYQKAIVFAQV